MNLPPIYGFNECSEMGNDIFAPSVFLGGCNLKCPYCMNSSLVASDHNQEIDIEVIEKYVQDNACEWISISGGEPTCVEPIKLKNLICKFVQLGCKVGLATNGTNTEILGYVIENLNYVAMDIKTSKCEIYSDISGNSGSSYSTAFMNLLRTQALLAETKMKRSDFDYELRTTLYPEYVDKKVLKEIGTIIRAEDTWVLQQFRHATNMLSKKAYEVKPYTDQEAQSFLKIAQKITSKARLRYV